MVERLVANEKVEGSNLFARSKKMFKLFKKKKREGKNYNGISYSKNKSLIKIGKYTYGYSYLNLIEFGNGTNLEIGKFCSISEGVKIFLDYGGHNPDFTSSYPFQHLYDDKFSGKEYLKEHENKNSLGGAKNKGDVIIGNDVWIGLDALIMNGVKIGDGSIIGANSVITKDVKPYEFVAGNPGKHINFRFDDEIIKLLKSLEWWNLEDKLIKLIVKDLREKPNVEILKELIKKYK